MNVNSHAFRVPVSAAVVALVGGGLWAGLASGHDPRAAAAAGAIPASATSYHWDTSRPACLPLSDPNGFTVAVPAPLFRQGAACGSYLAVTYGGKTITVKVDNLCPDDCPQQPPNLDLSKQAMAALPGPQVQPLQVTYQVVKNPLVAGGIQVQLRQLNPFWTSLRIDNTGNELRSVEIGMGADGPLLPMTRHEGQWTLQDGTQRQGPFRLRVTDIYGQTTTLTDLRYTLDLQNTPARLYQ